MMLWLGILTVFAWAVLLGANPWLLAGAVVLGAAIEGLRLLLAGAERHAESRRAEIAGRERVARALHAAGWDVDLLPGRDTPILRDTAWNQARRQLEDPLASLQAAGFDGSTDPLELDERDRDRFA